MVQKEYPMSDEATPAKGSNGGVFTWFLATAVLAVLALIVGVIALFSPANGEGPLLRAGEARRPSK